MYEDNVRIVYVKKKILIKEVSKEWYIKTNGIKDIILDKEKIYNKVINYLKNCCKNNEKIINEFLKEFKLKIEDNKVLEKMNELKENNAKILHGGRYGITLSIQDMKVLKIQKLYHINNIKKYLKEIFMCYYINKLYNLSPKIYSIYFYEINDKEKEILRGQHIKLNEYLKGRHNKYKYICGTYLMDKVEYIFCDLFDAYAMYIAYEQKNKFILENFVLALKICIGNFELLLEKNINHNDLHDGNFGFTANGNFRLIDFGMTTIIDYNNKKYKKITLFEENKEDAIRKYLLLRELKYLRDMYYFEEESCDLEEFYEDKNYSPIKQVIDKLKKEEYKFGSYKKYVNQKIDVSKIKKIIMSISDA